VTQANVSQAMEGSIMTSADMNRLLHEVVKMQPDMGQDFEHVHQDHQSGYHMGDQPMGYGAQNMDFSFDQITPDAVTAAPISGGEPRRSRGSTNQTNENELKDMLEKNLARSLDEVAAEVTQNERTSSAEKTKQLFAMLW
jgi:regulatory factor X